MSAAFPRRRTPADGPLERFRGEVALACPGDDAVRPDEHGARFARFG